MCEYLDASPREILFVSAETASLRSLRLGVAPARS